MAQPNLNGLRMDARRDEQAGVRVSGGVEGAVGQPRRRQMSLPRPVHIVGVDGAACPGSEDALSIAFRKD